MARGRGLGGNGGIGGSGVFGFFGSTVTCKSDDTSYYCLFVKFFNVIIMLLALIAIFYFLYTVVGPMVFKRGRK
jgi:hypothetical protein